MLSELIVKSLMFLLFLDTVYIENQFANQLQCIELERLKEDRCDAYVCKKRCSLYTLLTATDQKPQKS